jgi:hypothetical protein
MFKQSRLTVEQAVNALGVYKQIPIRFDPYLLRCAQKQKAPLLTLDKALFRLVKQLKLQVISDVKLSLHACGGSS